MSPIKILTVSMLAFVVIASSGMAPSEGPPGLTRADAISIVQARIAELTAIGLGRQAPLSPRYLVRSAAVSTDVFAYPGEGGEFSSLTFSDAANEVIIDLWSEDGAWQVLRVWHNGELLGDDPLAVEIGRVYHHRNPELAKIEIEGKIAAAEAGEQVAETRSIALTALSPDVPASDGLTVFYFPEAPSSAGDLMSVGTVVIAGNSGTNMAYAMFAGPAVPVPVQQVCQHLFDVCIHGTSEAAIKACELFLRHCAPLLPGAAQATSSVNVGRYDYGDFSTITLQDDSSTVHIDVQNIDGGWTLATLFADGELLTNEPRIVELGERLTYSDDRVNRIHDQIARATAGEPIAVKNLEIAPLSASADLSAPGLTIFYFPEEGAATRGLTMTSSGSALVVGHDGEQMMFAFIAGPPTPIQQVCAHLFQVCTHGSSQAAIQACELWLRYCATQQGAAR